MPNRTNAIRFNSDQKEFGISIRMKSSRNKILTMTLNSKIQHPENEIDLLSDQNKTICPRM